MNENIRKKIQNLRTEKGLTQNDLANYLNLSPKVISRWETGNSIPDLDNIMKLAELFNISCDEFLDNNIKSNTLLDSCNKQSNNMKFQKVFYSIILCILFCFLEIILYAADVAPKIAYIIFGLVFCIFVILDAICYK